SCGLLDTLTPSGRVFSRLDEHPRLAFLSTWSTFITRPGSIVLPTTAADSDLASSSSSLADVFFAHVNAALAASTTAASCVRPSLFAPPLQDARVLRACPPSFRFSLRFRRQLAGHMMQ
ncbi:hypothetical protein HK405_012750, partial [Cladochytrium tenue]